MNAPAAVTPMAIMAAITKKQVRSRKVFIVFHHLVLSDANLARCINFTAAEVGGDQKKRARHM
jgi:hypothetical protein